MASIYIQQKEMVDTIFKHIKKEKGNLDTLYSEFINKLEKDNPMTQNYKDIDELFLSKVPQAKQFYDLFKENDTEILHWYDMNLKQFISPIEGYNSKIIKEYNFQIYGNNHDTYDNLFKNTSTIDKIQMPILELALRVQTAGLISRNSYNIVFKDIHNRTTLNQIIMEKFDIKPDTPITGTLLISSNFHGFCSHCFYILIDNQLNIIIPAIKTIIINNYQSFPLYSLYSIYEKLNFSEICNYNLKNENDKKLYESIISSINFDNYLSSEDQRQQNWSNGNNFQNILDFLEYQDMINSIKPYLDFIVELTPKSKTVLTSESENKNSQQTSPTSSYEDILFQNIKELQQQLREAKEQIVKVEKEKDEITEKYTNIQYKIKQFLEI